MSEQRAIQSRFEGLGFALVHTGGNCSAYATDGFGKEGRPYLMVTVAEDASAPSEYADPVALCRYQDWQDAPESLLDDGTTCGQLLGLLERRVDHLDGWDNQDTLLLTAKVVECLFYEGLTDDELADMLRCFVSPHVDRTYLLGGGAAPETRLVVVGS